MKALRQAASRLGEMAASVASGIEQAAHSATGSGQGKPSDVDGLDESRSRIHSLRQAMNGLKQALHNHAKQVVMMSQSASSLSSEWSGLYASSTARSQSLSTFMSVQSSIESFGVRLFKDEFGWDVLSVFDEWDREASKMAADIDKTEKARAQVQALEEKVRSLRASKERRVKRGEQLTPKEEQQLEGSEQMLDKYNIALSNMRLNLDKNLTHFFDRRFATLDKAFVRLMEMQMEFFRECSNNAERCSTIVENYRKRFPRGGMKSKTMAAPLTSSAGTMPSDPTAPSVSPLPGTASEQGTADLLNLHVSPTPLGGSASYPTQDIPARSRSTPPQSNGVAPQRAAAQPSHRNVREESESDSDSDSGSDDDASSSSDDDTPAHSRNGSISQPAAAKQAPAQMDLFHIPDASPTSTAKKPSASPSPPASKPRAQPPPEESIVDFFGGAAHTTLSAQPVSTSSQQPKSTSSGSTHSHTSSTSSAVSPTSEVDFSFDFSGGSSSSSSSSTANNNNKHLPQSVSTPSLNSNFISGLDPMHSDTSASNKGVSQSSAQRSQQQQQKSKKGDDLLSFDPFGMGSVSPARPQPSPSNRIAAPQSIPSFSTPSLASPDPSRIRSNTPPPAEPGSTQSGLATAYIPPTHQLEDHIKERQQAKIEEMRAREAAVENELEARRQAERELEATLSAWECTKDGVKKNIRNLLSSVHTVLWANSGWKPVSFADLIDFNAIKKAHMKVIRVVHPDRLTNATPEQMVIALRVFDSLNTAFDEFKQQQGM